MKPYQFQFSANAEHDFASFSQILQKKILGKLKFFEKTENFLNFAKKLRGLENTYRFRIGDYRIIVTPKDQKTIVILLILKIGHRKEIYE